MAQTEQTSRKMAASFMEHTLQSLGIARDYLREIPVDQRDALCRAALKSIKKDHWEQFPTET
jgi:hypothetical protein